MKEGMKEYVCVCGGESIRILLTYLAHTPNEGCLNLTTMEEEDRSYRAVSVSSPKIKKF